uniref:Uncharacterized protein n=1 Tax=Helianthus annuus TaxID=4232 RepID=A0A251SQW9_HELAN
MIRFAFYFRFGSSQLSANLNFCSRLGHTESTRSQSQSGYGSTGQRLGQSQIRVLSTFSQRPVNSQDPLIHVLGTTLRNHVKLALHRNFKVALSKLWNGWNRRTHGNSST